MAEIARRLGSEAPPETVNDLNACIDDFRSECAADSQTRDALRFLLFPPVPLWLRGSYGILTAGAVTLLPRWARQQLWLPVPPFVDPLAVRPAAVVMTKVIGWLMSADPREFELQDRMMVD